MSTGNEMQTDIRVERYVREKVERIDAALLLIADALPEGHAYRKGLQDHALKLVDVLRTGRSAPRARDISAHTASVVSLVRTLMHAGMLSQRNAMLLTHELEQFCHDIETYGWTERVVGIPSALLHVERPDMREAQEREPARSRAAVRVLKDTTRRERGSGLSEKDTRLAQGLTDERRYGEKKTSEAPTATKKDRRARILGLLQTRDKISIKDVAAVMGDWSDKTLQRELLALVSQGVLKKEGEKRWSTYTLA